MTRNLFLTELRIALQGQISQAQVNEQLEYYEKYIIEESRKGRTEEEVLESLGSPRLIAKTVIQMYGSPVNPGAKGEEAYRETGGGRAGHRPFYRRVRYAKLLSALFLAVCVLVAVRIGLLLLPLLASVFMVGGIGYVIFLIFSGNKK